MIISFDEFVNEGKSNSIIVEDVESTLGQDEIKTPEKTIGSYSPDDIATALFKVLGRVSELEGELRRLKNQKENDQKGDEDLRPPTLTAGDNWHEHTHWRNLDLDTPKKRPYGDQHYHTSWRNLEDDPPMAKPKNYQHPHTHWRNLEEDGDL